MESSGEDALRMKQLRLVLTKVLDSTSMALQTNDVISSFSQLVQEKPEASKAIEEYHPQLLVQIRENVQVRANLILDFAKVQSCRHLNQISIIGFPWFLCSRTILTTCVRSAALIQNCENWRIFYLKAVKCLLNFFYRAIRGLQHLTGICPIIFGLSGSRRE